MSVLLDLIKLNNQKNKDLIPYWNRSLSDGGIIYDTSRKYLQKLFDDNAKYGSNLKLCINTLAATKLRTSGVNNFATKSYDIAPHSPQLGPELVVNGDFSNGSTGWISTTWNISGGIATQDGSINDNLTQTGILVIGKTYIAEFDCVRPINLTRFYFGGSANTAYNLVNGRNKIIGIAEGTSVTFRSGTGGLNTIDNVSVREVLINDATQPTATNQPYLSKIAPIEKPALLNPNGDDCYMVHPTISFGASDTWSVEMVMNDNGANGSRNYIGKNEAGKGTFGRNSTNLFYFLNDNGTVYNLNAYSSDLGKNSIYHLVSIGGTIYLHINGTQVHTTTAVTTFILNSILTARTTAFAVGKLYHYSIFSKALTPSEIANRAALLRSIYPEIESVPIGTQTWQARNYDAVCTPQGNLIPEVQAATNTEKITNAADREFSSDTGFWTKGGETTITGGICNIKSSTGTVSNIVRNSLITVGKWYKFQYDIAANRGGQISCDTFGGTPLNSTVGTNKIVYGLASSATFDIKRYSGITDIDIDNVSVQEVGWADSQNLYDYVYANTAGTVEQKTYAAVKAAGMWCHYNNDPANGAIYSKLYNWFAVKLMQMDIDYYNAANPTTPWGWRVNSDSDQSIMQNYLGNSDADKLKHQGSMYWTSGTGTNTTGFTMLPSGYRDQTGVFRGINTDAILLSSDNNDIPIVGGSIRLIKQ